MDLSTDAAPKVTLSCKGCGANVWLPTAPKHWEPQMNRFLKEHQHEDDPVLARIQPFAAA